MRENFKKIISCISVCFILLFLLAVLNRTGSLLLFWKEEPSGSITHDAGYGHYVFVRDENLSKLDLPFFLKEDETFLEPDPLSVNEDITASIKEAGGGRYQLLPNNDLYLSASDGDPEGHEYFIISPVIIRNRYLLVIFALAALTAAADLILCLKHKDPGIIRTVIRAVTIAFFLMLLLPWNRMTFPAPPLKIGPLLVKPVLQRNAVFTSVLFILLLLSIRFSGRSKVLGILSVLILLTNTAYYFVPEWNWFGCRQDSAGYIEAYTASSIRTPGYPAFIETVYRLRGNEGLAEVRAESETSDESLKNGITEESHGLLSVTHAQKIILAAAFLILSFVCCRYYDPLWLAFAAQIILCGGFLGVDNSYIMSECLAQAALLAASVFFILTVKERKTVPFLILCILSGIAILIRPTNLILGLPIFISLVILIQKKQNLLIPAAGILAFLAIAGIPAMNIARHYGIFLWMPSSGYAEINRAMDIMQPGDEAVFEDPELKEFCGELITEKERSGITDHKYVWQIAVPLAEAHGYDTITCSPLFKKISKQIFKAHFKEFTAALTETVLTALERTRLQIGPIPFIALLILSLILFAVRIRTDSFLGLIFVLLHCGHMCMSMMNRPERRYIYSTEILCLLGWLLILINLADRRSIDRKENRNITPDL